METTYETPAVIDYGDVGSLTAAAGTVGTEDGAGKTIHGGIEGVTEVSVGIFP